MANAPDNGTGASLAGEFRRLAEAIPQLVWVAAPDGHSRYVNRRWCDYTGLTADDAKGFGWESIVHPEDLPALREQRAAAFAAGEPLECEIRVRRHDGAYRWFLVRVEPDGESGTDGPVAWFGTATDIHDWKVSENVERRLSDERYRRLVETAHDGIAEIDLRGRFRYVNERMAAMLGYQPDEMVGHRIFDFAFPEDHESGRAHIARRARGIRQSFEWRWQHKDGSEVWTLAGAAPISGTSGRPVGSVGIFSDLTDRRAALQKLQASEERFRTSVEALLDCFAILTAIRNDQGEIVDFRVDYVNEAACLSNRMTREAQIGHSLLELFPGTRDSELFATYRQVVETGQPRMLETESYIDDFGGKRESRWFDISASRLGDGFVLAWRDVSERRRLESAFRELADTSPAILWETSRDGRCTFLSYSWTELTGQPVADGLGFGWIDCLHPDERGLVRDRFRSANERETSFDMEYRVKGPDGNYLWAFAAGRPRLDENGVFTGFVGSTVDIDDRKRIEDNLRTSEQRLRLAAEVAAIGTFEWDIQQNVNLWTPELEGIYGMPPGSFPGTYEAWRETVHPDDIDTVEESLAQAIETGEFTSEWRIRRADGSTRWVEARGWVFRDDAGKPSRMIGVNFDITDRKVAEEALHDASRRKDAFLAVLAHELRNPLAPVRNAAALLTRVDPADSGTFRRAIEVIDRQVSHMARLTDDLLDVSRIARGGIRLRAETVDIAEIVRQTIEDYRPTLEEAGLTLQAVLPAAPVWVEGDAVRLAQVVGNLLHNASKFTNAGGSVTVDVQREGPDVTVTVEDDGRGMTPEMQAHLFEPFSQADDSLDRSLGGLGLGLALVKGLMELHGGSVTALSDGPDTGSAFVLRLPIAADTGKAAPAERPAGEARGGLRVLLIEDNADAASSLAMLLRLDDHEVAIATDGHEGLDTARRMRPDVVLCDIGLPGGMDGYEVGRALRADPDLGEFTLVAVTGYGQADDRQRTKDAGFDLHLLKPLDLKALGELLATLPRQ